VYRIAERVRIVLTALGTFGDVGPLLRLAAAVEGQGDSAVVLVNPHFETHARSLGLTVRPVGPRWDPDVIARDPRYQDPSHVWREIFAPRVRTDFAATLTVIDEAPTSGVVNHFWGYGGALAAEARGLPWAMVALAPMAWLSAADPSQLSALRIPRRLLTILTRSLLRPRTRLIYEPALRQAARDVGLRFVADRFWGTQKRAALNLGLWSPLWRGGAADDPPMARIVGFPATSTVGSVAPEVEAFFMSGAPPVVMGLGSVLPRVSRALYRDVAEACMDLGRRVLLVGAPQGAGAGLGPSVHTTTAVPYASVFPRASLVIHHGGIGSTAEGLRAGKPTLVVPFGNDQHDNASRVERLGVGLALDKGNATGKRLRAALLRGLTSEAMSTAAVDVALRIRQEEDGEVAAAREIRRVLGPRSGR
jgi:rhamnosyltransferase subunit B